MPPYQQTEVRAKRSALTPSRGPVHLPVTECEVNQLWNQYCTISNASLRRRRGSAGPTGATNFWAGTFEPNRQINIDVLLRSKNLRVRVLDHDLDPSTLPVFLPNMAVPLEVTPKQLLEDIHRTISLEILDPHGRIVGYCLLKATWFNCDLEPSVCVTFTKDRYPGAKPQACKLESCGQAVQVYTTESVSGRTRQATRTFEIVLC